MDISETSLQHKCRLNLVIGEQDTFGAGLPNGHNFVVFFVKIHTALWL